MSIPISPADQPGKRTLVDGFFRTVTYLRVSVTDRCDLRCVYCMSPDMTFLPKKELLTLDELDRVCSAFIARGVQKLRLTGGEPLMRRGFLDLVRSLSRHLKSGDLQELTLTTNGTQLAKYASEGLRELTADVQDERVQSVRQHAEHRTAIQVLEAKLDAIGQETRSQTPIISATASAVSSLQQVLRDREELGRQRSASWTMIATMAAAIVAIVEVVLRVARF